MSPTASSAPAGAAEEPSPLAAAQRACGARDWERAFDLLAAADRGGSLPPQGLELIAECARWTGRWDCVIDPLERAHAAHAAAGDKRAALRTALALCHAHGDACHKAVAASWWRRAAEIVEELPEGPEHGLYAWFCARACGDRGDIDGHERAARTAHELARRFGDRDVEALALLELGSVATARGRGAEALDALDRATALALGGEIGVLAAGTVFCGAILACRSRGEWQRAREWTDSADRWVRRQQVAYFPGLCRVHRAEVLRVRGALADAEQESLEAARLLRAGIPRWEMIAHAELGEVRRRRGDLAGAMAAFRQALELGWDPQPGLALTMLAQGDAASALRAIDRVVRQPPSTWVCEDRASLGLARTTIAIAAGALETAAHAAGELAQLAHENGTAWDTAAAARARGELELARGCPTEAVRHLDRARAIWAELDAPYELATARALLGRALLAEGDAAGARLELAAARDACARIGALGDRDRAASCLDSIDAPPAGTPAPSPRATEASLRREGEVWTLLFDGRALRLRDSRGVRYLATLLAHPGTDQWAIDLAAPASAPGHAAADGGDAGELLDAEARRAYRTRLTELEQELAEARAHHDPNRIDSARAEMDELGRQLAAAVGLAGRPRRAGAAIERARQSVTKALRGLIHRLAREDPALGHYLRTTIRTGTACRFEPDQREWGEWGVG